MKNNISPVRRLAAVAGLAGYLLYLSWLRWGADLVYDVGREMCVPAFILQGRMPYRDFFYLYGPLPPFLSAAFYSLLGVRLASLHVAGGLALAGVCWLLYLLGREYLPPWQATAALLVFIAVLPFQCYYFAAIFTYLLPYSFAALYATFFALAALWTFQRFLVTGRGAFRAGTAVYLALGLLCKVEIGLAAGGAVAATLALRSLQQPRGPAHRPRGRDAALLLLPPLLVLAVSFFGIFLVSPPEGRKLLLGLGLYNFSLKSAAASGFSAGALPLDLLVAVLTATATLAGYLLLVTAGGLFLARLADKRLPLPAVAAIGVSWLGVCILLYRWLANPLEIFLCLPAVIAVALIHAVRTRSLSLFTLAAVALFFSLRILLDLRAAGFGTFLLVPGVLLIAVVILGLFPGRVRAGPARVMATAGACTLLAFVSLAHVMATRANFLKAVLELRTPRGIMRLPPERFNVDLLDLVNYLRTSTPPGSTLAVFPEGLPVNFLAERENPLYFTNYIRVELTQPGVREAVLNDLERKRPDYVALVWRSESEYGSEESFENGYGAPIVAWLRQHYVPEFSTETAMLLRHRDAVR
ncbi:MAG: hypothetical protein ACYC9Y_02560 [Candidatus Methylomirabilia bacterium]